MKYITLLLIFTLGIFAASRPLLPATPYAQIEDKIGKGTPYFLEVGSDSCKSCRKMGKMLFVIKEKHPKAPIYFINVHEERSTANTLKIMMIPTQIIYDTKGKEVFRHVGGLSQEELDIALDQYHVLVKKKTKPSTITWMHDYDDALALAQKVHKPMLLFISQEHCGSCKFMKEEVFTNTQLIDYINVHFIPIMLDISDMMVPDELQVEVTPVFHFLDEKGKKLRESLIGEKTAPFFLPMLKKVIEKH